MDEMVQRDGLIINCLPLTELERRRFHAASGDVKQFFLGDITQRGSMQWTATIPADLREQATAVIGNIPADTVRQYPKLEWLQTWSAGVDRYTRPGIMLPDTVLTSASGAYGQSVAEHLFAMMWSLMKNLPGYRDSQHRHEWQDLGPAMSPEGATVVVIGTGDIGSHFAKLAKGVGAHTLGVRRSPNTPADGIDTMFGFDALDVLMTKADVVVCVLPSSPETHYLLNSHRMDLLKEGAIVLNGGRGDAIDPAALERHIHKLRGVGLDVTETEPLPADNPLWDEPRCLITPHAAGGYHLETTVGRILDIVLDNVSRYTSGQPLRNEVRHN